MKKITKSISAIALAVVLILGLSVTALAADSSVTFEGEAEKFVFLSDSQYSNQSLFNNFENVLPGDTVTQKITVKNTSGDSDFIIVYLRAVPHDEEKNPLSEIVGETETVASMTDFLSKLSMTVKNGETVIFEGAPSETGGLTENVMIAELKKDESIDLTVELTVPVDLGNEYANRRGEVDWVFSVEGLDVPPPKPPTPGGDYTEIVPYVVLLAVGFVLLALAVLLLRKKKASK